MNWFISTSSTGQDIIICVTDGKVLSFVADEYNTDYQAYMAWLAEGNTPEPWEAD